ncbi:MAG TPA: YlbF family regulator [Bacillota bacterium]|jgi:cell fate (sporulation/competence/biofilm development) regulator YlbF (YheA/YmcA/DUF963 family)|nr:YlbF family regulator [Peptococcaceae bacterium MAG4]NLW38263.1 YlbF family regulator [Peptococcaceae bacterium]HPU35646.1 YlbF family regulator [Bacillota bacterium]HPZ42399.1 YlbF family regulator [Bacillota bacterium]HQD75065.1 YlbF family regulator [Bacillota bacterium]
MSVTVYSKAKELAAELSKSKELHNVREAEARMLQDPEAWSIIDSFQKKQQVFYMLQSQGQTITEAQKKELEELEKQMVENPLIFDYFKAQQDFEQVLERINRIIGESIGLGPECNCESECAEGSCDCNGC